MPLAEIHWELTIEQFLRLPEAKPALEMAPGCRVTQKAMPSFPHSILQTELATRLQASAASRRLGCSFVEVSAA
jgi:hypothetical protein